MGWETLAIAGFSALNAVNTVNQGTAQAKAITQQAQQQAQVSADNTVRAGGKLTTSFLQSGLTLEGGPMDVLTQAFGKGQTDIARIASNANAASKNAVNSARTKALEGLASSAGMASLGSTVGGAVDSGINSFGQTAGSLFDSSPTGPYLSPFTSQFYRYQVTGTA